MSSQQQFSFMEVSPASVGAGERSRASTRQMDVPVPQAAASASRHGQDRQSDPAGGSADAGQKTPSRESVLQALRTKVGCVSTARSGGGESFSSGCDAIDDWLPIGGLHPATLTEWVAASASAAAGTLSMLAAASRLRQVSDRPLVIVDCEGSFYPPAAAALGISTQRMILLRPRSGSDAIWAIDQSLRSGAVAAVWASLPMQVDDRDARRLQLAAETGRTPGLLVRDFHARGKPSFSEVQFYVADGKRQRVYVADGKRQRGEPRLARQRPSSLSRVSTAEDFETLSVTLDRVRGGVVGRQIELQIDGSANVRPLPSSGVKRHETAAEHLAAQLANPTIAKRVAARSVAQRVARRGRNAS